MDHTQFEILIVYSDMCCWYLNDVTLRQLFIHYSFPEINRSRLIFCIEENSFYFSCFTSRYVIPLANIVYIICQNKMCLMFFHNAFSISKFGYSSYWKYLNFAIEYLSSIGRIWVMCRFVKRYSRCNFSMNNEKDVHNDSFVLIISIYFMISCTTT